MPKPKNVFQCNECGGQTSKWQGQCPHCNAWNTLIETVVLLPSRRFENLSGTHAELRQLSAIETASMPRIVTGMTEFDRVLGGGFVSGEVVLLGGDPGIGKSTLLLQVAATLGANRQTLYITHSFLLLIGKPGARFGLMNIRGNYTVFCSSLSTTVS